MTDSFRYPSRRSFLLAMGAAALGAAGCAGDGHFNLFGYTTKPQYDTSIKTVYLPIFQNKAFQTTPSREMEMELTRAVIREIELKTPYKIVSDPSRADTEILGTVLRLTKGLPLRNQQNEVREFELVLVVEVVWRDLRTGKVLSNSQSRGPATPGEIFDPTLPVEEAGPEKARPVTVTSTGRGLPEAGESYTSAQTMAINRMAVKIAHLMESPWDVNAAECPR